MSADAPEVCHRCELPMTLGTLGEGSQIAAWYCSCCRSRLRTPALIVTDMEQRAAEKGITVAELREEGRKLINTDPIPPEQLEAMRSFARKRRDEWVPACEHDTENPWR